MNSPNAISSNRGNVLGYHSSITVWLLAASLPLGNLIDSDTLNEPITCTSPSSDLPIAGTSRLFASSYISCSITTASQQRQSVVTLRRGGAAATVLVLVLLLLLL